jgi:hypothetical protein
MFQGVGICGCGRGRVVGMKRENHGEDVTGRSTREMTRFDEGNMLDRLGLCGGRVKCRVQYGGLGRDEEHGHLNWRRIFCSEY